MPKRTDIKKILIVGAGPIVIGQACEFDYSGTQACKALKEEGYEVILVNSNPATIMTDPDFADRTYIEPVTAAVVEMIIERERPCALLPTMGGQTALNVSVEVAEKGVLAKYGVELIGADLRSIKMAEDRDEFQQAMKRIGLSVPKGGFAHSMDEARAIAADIGFPVIIRPSFTLGGTGGSIAYNSEEYEEKVKAALEASPADEVLLEESIIGWKEFELEVMRDSKDNVVIICSIENLDPMGVHTGDSITVAPAQTLSDKEYQELRDASLKIIREIGVDTGGSNVQFAINPIDGRISVIEMNPRVSRSSALASKATGFPIAKIAAKLAVGYTLDEIPNDITRETPASFEPTIDYVVVKFPRFAFEKFPQSDQTLTTQMKSVGEVMAIGRTFKEALQKSLRSLEIGSFGFESEFFSKDECHKRSFVINGEKMTRLREKLVVPGVERLWYVADAIRGGLDIDDIYELTRIDRWFLYNIKQIVDLEEVIAINGLEVATLQKAKQFGFSDRRIAYLTKTEEGEVKEAREKAGIKVTYKRVDTCGAEFVAHTPYLYSTYESEDEADVTDRKKIMILGGGPNRIGQGIEFDYCCVHGAFALSEIGYETIMVNCNPETVSTDYDTSDRLYFEPLTFEDVMSIVEKERPVGVIVQFGGQTPLKLALSLWENGVPIIGTSPDSIDRAEDRERFKEVLDKLGLKQPDNGIARAVDEAERIADDIGYPVVVRPSYVLGGRAMEIVYDLEGLRNYMQHAVMASPEHPVLIDKFLKDAIELDVDALADGEDVMIGGIMEHIEEAGIHSGDSACSLPPYSVGDDILNEIRRQTRALGLELQVKGLMNIQFAVKGAEIFIIEVNPRASRTVPFVSKATGLPLAKVCAKVMSGMSLKELGVTKEIKPSFVSVKEAVFPFTKFPGVDTLLGPEMRSTGEVMGIDKEFGRAFIKAQQGAGVHLPSSGRVFVSVRDDHKESVLPIVRTLFEKGFEIIATRGTAKYLAENGVSLSFVNKVGEGRPDIVDRLKSSEIEMVINTTIGKESIAASFSIRRTALLGNIPYFTTISGARAAVAGIVAAKEEGLGIKTIQEYHIEGD
ncbi:MAG: carbamoyl-phosphate synthase large subunit [bacterium]|nr:carbamoyl-phosphate synthase large subunit [bacterium]